MGRPAQMFIHTNPSTMRNLIVLTSLLAVASAGHSFRRQTATIPTQLTVNGQTTLVDLVVKAGLAEALSGPGPFTVFAPTNEAFRALSPDLLAKLGSDADLLKKVLTYHVVPARLAGASLVNDGTSTTLSGGKLRVNLYGRQVTTVNGVEVVRTIAASNGVIHVIKKVLVPKAERTIVGALAGDQRFGTLVKAADAANLVSTLDSAGPFTLFAPTDEAFASLPSGALEGLLADPKALQKVLLGHVVSGTVFSRGLSNGPVPFVSGDAAEVSLARSGVTVGSSRVTQADIATSNGVIHVIDKVILPAPQPDIVGVLTADSRFSTLATAATAAGLIPTLQSTGPFTLFAPTDAAFRALPAGALDGLIANPEKLKAVLLGHVVSGKVLSTDLQTGDVPFVSGDAARAVVSRAGVTIGSSNVIQADVAAANGVIHVIDKVILPAPQPNIVGVLTADKRFSTLATAATVAGLIPTLESAGPFTLFAPTDAAFRALPAGALDGLIADPEKLKAVLLGHVVSGKVLSTDLQTGDVPFVSGDVARAVVSRAGVTIGSSNVVQADVAAANGVIHVIDKVILPAPQPNIVGVLTADNRFSTLATAATVAGLIPTLESAGPFTLFAPTDAAFRALPAGALDGLIANPEKLKAVLLGHVVSGKVLSTDLQTGDVPLVGGGVARAVVSNAGVSISKAQVIQADIAASNGIIHVIDTVI